MIKTPLHNYTVFMTKPWLEMSIEFEAIAMLEDYLQETGEFKRETGVRVPKLPNSFFEEFYASVKKSYPEIYEKMIADFETLTRGPIILFYSGIDITKRVKKKLGPTKYKDNINLDTIRRKFMNPEDPNWRNIAHAPEPEEVMFNLQMIDKYELLN